MLIDCKCNAKLQYMQVKYYNLAISKICYIFTDIPLSNDSLFTSPL